MAAAVVGATNEHATDAHAAHLAEGDFLLADEGGHGHMIAPIPPDEQPLAFAVGQAATAVHWSSARINRATKAPSPMYFRGGWNAFGFGHGAMTDLFPVSGPERFLSPPSQPIYEGSQFC